MSVMKNFVLNLQVFGLGQKNFIDTYKKKK